jgi:hypothetical protein
MPQVRSDGAWTDHVDEGLGDPALLLLPGWCGTRAAFDSVRSDFRQHGRPTAAPHAGYTSSGTRVSSVQPTQAGATCRIVSVFWARADRVLCRHAPSRRHPATMRRRSAGAPVFAGEDARVRRNR